MKKFYNFKAFRYSLNLSPISSDSKPNLETKLRFGLDLSENIPAGCHLLKLKAIKLRKDKTEPQS